MLNPYDSFGLLALLTLVNIQIIDNKPILTNETQFNSYL